MTNINSEDPLFNINFVRIIENRPCLWNYNLSEYSKRNVTEKAWKEVSGEVQDTVANCRERWRNIRGAFLRSLKNLPSGSGTNTKKKYYLADHLQFVLPYTKSKATTGNLELLLESNANSEGNNEENLEDQDQISQDEPYQDANELNSLSDPTRNQHVIERNREKGVISPTSMPKKRKVLQSLTASNRVDDAFVDWLKSKKEKDCNIPEDPNMSFFRSLLPDLRKMTDRQSRRFRQKVIGLVDDILDDADIRPSSTLSSTSNTRTSFDQHTIACPTPSPNSQWYVQERRTETSGRGQNNVGNEERPWTEYFTNV